MNEEEMESEIEIYLSHVIQPDFPLPKAIKMMYEKYKKYKQKDQNKENLKIANKKIAAQRGQLMMLNKAYIPKSKVKQILYPTPENPIDLEIQNSKMYKDLCKLIGE